MVWQDNVIIMMSNSLGACGVRAGDKEIRRRKWPRYVKFAERVPLPGTMFPTHITRREDAGFPT